MTYIEISQYIICLSIIQSGDYIVRIHLFEVITNTAHGRGKAINYGPYCINVPVILKTSIHRAIKRRNITRDINGNTRNFLRATFCYFPAALHIRINKIRLLENIIGKSQSKRNRFMFDSGVFNDEARDVNKCSRIIMPQM